MFGRSVGCLCLSAVLAGGCGATPPPTLAIGSPAPAFSLPGVDGQTHALTDYAASPVLAVIFTCNHCPVSELYERRIQQLYADYRERGVAVVAINPDSPKTIALKELAYSDLADTLADMKARVTYRHLEYPYLYDGDAQTAATAFKIVATPHIFVFDQQRTLRYQGRIDDNLREDQVKTRDARNAIDALLARGPVAVETTRAAGCPVKWLSATQDVREETAALQTAPVNLQLVGAPDLKALRRNGTKNLMVVNFWATWCPPCIIEFPDLQTMYRMYRSRNVELVTVSVDVPEARSAVEKLLHAEQASSTNRMFATDDTAGLQDAFDPLVPASVPFTLLIAPNGDVLHQQSGEADVPALRRAILANLPDDPKYPGLQAYWAQQ